MKSLFLRLVFILRYRFIKKISQKIRTTILRLKGVSIGKNVEIESCYFTWYHNIKLGDNCTIERHVFFNANGAFNPKHTIIIGDKTFIGNGCEFNIAQNITIGYHCAIASGCKFIDHNHGFDTQNVFIGLQPAQNAPIKIEDDVWLGVNVVVLKNVHIGQGAIVGAGSVVTKSIPPYEIWGGVPAVKIRNRKK
jgi:acetyltransferase-like isoleucine patch superfamily enzyme